jgi:hypothetical protein
MIRQIAIAASAALMIVAPDASLASPIPGDKGVGTWVLVPLTRGDNGETGFGMATVQVDVLARKICYAMDFNSGTNVTDVRLSKGSGPEPGQTVIQLKKSLRGNGWDNCVELDPPVAQAILANPSNYYVDVQTSSVPGGNLRARLEGPGTPLP